MEHSSNGDRHEGKLIKHCLVHITILMINGLSEYMKDGDNSQIFLSN